MKTFKFFNRTTNVTVTLDADSYANASKMVPDGFGLFSITK